MAKHESNRNNEQVIRLEDIMYIVLKHFKTMVGVAIIGLLVGILISFASYVRGLASVEYYITASIAVTSTNENGLFSTGSSSDPNASDIHLAEDITDAVIYVCKSDTTLNAAAERLQLIGVKAEDIKPNLTLAQYEKTQIIEMRLVWNNKEEGIMILEAITDVVPEILIKTLKIGDVSIVNAPKAKQASLSFIDAKVVAICFLAGAFLSAAFYLVKYFLHPTFLHSDDVKEAYDIDILGEIPGSKGYFSKKVNSFSANDFLSVQEYFSACAHVLVYRLQDIDNVCIYITSSAAKEGKSSITANIGYALADLGYKTLLMDMDVRNPSLAGKFIFDNSSKHTLNAVYRGDVDVHDAIVKINSNLHILPTRIEDERLRLDNKVVEIISNAKAEYDFVIIDTAPVGQVSDSMSINQAADCALFVVRQDQVWISTITESINRLRKTGITILGAIMNDTKDGASAYYQHNRKELGDSPYVHFDEDDKRSKKKNRNTSLLNTDVSDISKYILNRRKQNQEAKERRAGNIALDQAKTETESQAEPETVVEATEAKEAETKVVEEVKATDRVIEFNKPKDAEATSNEPEIEANSKPLDEADSSEASTETPSNPEE